MLHPLKGCEAAEAISTVSEALQKHLKQLKHAILYTFA